MLKRITRAASQFVASSLQPLIAGQLQKIIEQQSLQAISLGRLHAARVASLPDGTPLSSAEFKVCSQWGEDGIIQFLLTKVPISNAFFVEFGIQDYVESNTRFLLLNNNWSGLVMDSDERNIDYVTQDPIYWKHELQAKCAFITADNVDALIAQAVPTRDIGLLSIDIDGNDYWVWRSINSVSPRIVIAEYNSVFGPRHAVTIPYEPNFQRTRAHSSNLYWGASLAALCDLGAEKGYRFVGCNTAGNNAFFVREDCAGRVPAVEPEAGYVRSKFRESRDAHGHLTFVTAEDRFALIAQKTVYDVRRKATVMLGELAR